MKWDNGRSLSLMPFEDSFTVIQNEQQATPDEQDRVKHPVNTDK